MNWTNFWIAFEAICWVLWYASCFASMIICINILVEARSKAIWIVLFVVIILLCVLSIPFCIARATFGG